MPDHPVEEAATLHLKPNEMGCCWHPCHSESPDDLYRVHLTRESVSKMGEIMPAKEQLSSAPAVHHEYQWPRPLGIKEELQGYDACSVLG